MKLIVSGKLQWQSETNPSINERRVMNADLELMKGFDLTLGQFSVGRIPYVCKIPS